MINWAISMFSSSNQILEISKSSKRSEFAFKKDSTLVAVGNVDGTIEIFSLPDWGYQHTFSEHKKLINNIAWNPLSPDNIKKEEEKLLCHVFASGCEDSTIKIFHCEVDKASNTKVMKCISILKGHTKSVTCINWNPHDPTKLLSSSYDGTAQSKNIFRFAE